MQFILVYLLGVAYVGASVQHRGLAAWLITFLTIAMMATLWWKA